MRKIRDIGNRRSIRKVIEGSDMDYLFLFGKNRTAYTDYSARNALDSGGHIYIMIEDANAAGYLCMVKEEEQDTVSYAWTVPEKRNTGIFTSLLKHAVNVSEDSVRVGISEKNAYLPAVLKVCLELGFTEQESCIVFQGNTEDFHNWKEYMEKTGQKIYDALVRQGFWSVSFSKAGQNLLEKLYDSDSGSFQNRLAVRPFFDNPQKGLDRDMSFMAIKDGEIVAYTLVSRPDYASAVFEHISVAEKHIGSGVIFMPFAKSMEMFGVFNCKRAAYAMYESNAHANAFRKKLLGKVTSSKRRSYNLFLNKEKEHE